MFVDYVGPSVSFYVIGLDGWMPKPADSQRDVMLASNRRMGIKSIRDCDSQTNTFTFFHHLLCRHDTVSYIQLVARSYI